MLVTNVDDPDGLFAAAGAVAELVVRTSVIRETAKRQQTLLENIDASIEAVRQRADDLAAGSKPLADLAVDTRQLAKAGAELLGGVVGDLDLAVSTAQACLEQLSELTSRVAEIGKFARSGVFPRRPLAVHVLEMSGRCSEQLTAADSLAVAGLAGRPGAGPAAGALRKLVAVLRPLFDVPRAHAGALVALSSDRAARGMSLNSGDLAELDRLLEKSLGSFAGLLCGVTVTVAPRVLADRERWMQWWTPGPQQLIPDLDPTSAAYYDYTTADWYQTPLQSAREYLSDPYFDEGGAEKWIVTASVPVFADRKPLGVTTADIDLDAVAHLCLPALRGLASPAALLSRSGMVVTSTDPDRLKVGVTPDAELHGWVLHAEGTHVSRADGMRLSRVPTLDWSLLELGAAVPA